MIEEIHTIFHVNCSGSVKPLSDRHLDELVGAPEHDLRRREPGCA